MGKVRKIAKGREGIEWKTVAKTKRKERERRGRVGEEGE